ncbi:MAG: hypothetical protein KGK17_11165 [Betaproteobacteria bacterium]|nr:hypothetical protein [Betaproteobacteria bacterium]
MNTTIKSGSDPGHQDLNSLCFCISLDEAALRRALESELGQPGLFDLVQKHCPHLFSPRAVFVSQDHLARMNQVVQAVTAVVALPAYQEVALSRAPAIARQGETQSHGVFFGYDFHVTDQHVGLIEINTNAGGALLNAVLARAQRACCPEMTPLISPATQADLFETRILAMFREEWRLAGAVRPLKSIAIVDDDPARQFLYPEFLLFQQYFQRHGLEATVADPADLQLRDGQLWHGAAAIDLVYNRLTDFSFGAPSHAVLREAWLSRAAVVTPHPRAHALYADKRNLALLTDEACLRKWGVPPATRDILLASIPPTEVVDAAQAERLWRERRHLFFKPVAGFGSRAAYRGDKLTQRVWQEILAGDYVAQRLVTPGERVITGETLLKFDLRNYVYDGAVQWVAARLYQGQTTNFRTPGGGFAPVWEWSGAGDCNFPLKKHPAGS